MTQTAPQHEWFALVVAIAITWVLVVKAIKYFQTKANQ